MESRIFGLSSGHGKDIGTIDRLNGKKSGMSLKTLLVLGGLAAIPVSILGYRYLGPALERTSLFRQEGSIEDRDVSYRMKDAMKYDADGNGSLNPQELEKYFRDNLY